MVLEYLHGVWSSVSAHLFSVEKPYEWVGYLATTFSALCYIPQIRRIRKTQSSKDISFWMFAIWIVGSSFWIIYGLRVHRWPIILTNGINLVFRLWVLAYKYVVDKKNKTKKM